MQPKVVGSTIVGIDNDEDPGAREWQGHGGNVRRMHRPDGKPFSARRRSGSDDVMIERTLAYNNQSVGDRDRDRDGRRRGRGLGHAIKVLWHAFFSVSKKGGGVAEVCRSPASSASTPSVAESASSNTPALHHGLCRQHLERVACRRCSPNLHVEAGVTIQPLNCNTRPPTTTTKRPTSAYIKVLGKYTATQRTN